jgi:hypothetical protein
MTRHNALRWGGSLGLVLVALLVTDGKASACTCYCDSICSQLGDCCYPGCGDQEASTAAAATVKVAPLPGHGARVVVTGLNTMAMSGGFDCSTALGGIPGVERITSLSLVHAKTGKPIYSFFGDDLAGRSFEELAADLDRGDPNTKWLGFHTRMENDVAGEIPSQFVIDVKLKRGVSFLKFASDLRNRGIFGGGSANVDGTLDLHHYFLRDLKNFDFQIKIPRGKPGRK